MEALRKGRFLAEEDAVLRACVEKFGQQWKTISKYLPGRSAKQIRLRFRALSSATKEFVIWTAEEDTKLVQLMANQDMASAKFATLTQFFPGRDRVQLRNRYITVRKWIKRHPNKDISEAPRRFTRRLRHEYGKQNLDKAVENLNKRIQSEGTSKSVKSRKINKDSPEEDIEHAIMTTLITEAAQEEAIRFRSCMFNIVDSESINTAGGNTATVNEKNLSFTLILLMARLNKELFKSSKYHMQYPRLEQDEIQNGFTKLKTYSKKQTESDKPIITVGPSVNIWDNPLRVTESVLPANYSTITGFIRLLTTYTENNMKINIAQIMRRNSIAKEQIELFRNRFKTLFLWPMLLSNENPKEKQPKAINKKNK